MALELTDEAIAVYRKEMQLEAGDHVRFFVRYGGTNGPGNGFSLGVDVAAPVTVGEKVEKDGITFYIEQDDLWLLEDVDLIIRKSDTSNDIEFVYRPHGGEQTS